MDSPWVFPGKFFINSLLNTKKFVRNVYSLFYTFVNSFCQLAWQIRFSQQHVIFLIPDQPVLLHLGKLVAHGPSVHP